MLSCLILRPCSFRGRDVLAAVAVIRNLCDIQLARLLTGDLAALDPAGQRAPDDVILCNVDQRVEKHVAVSRQYHQSPCDAVETRRRHLTT